MQTEDGFMANRVPIQTTILYQSTSYQENTTVDSTYSYLTTYDTETVSTRKDYYSKSVYSSYQSGTGSISSEFPDGHIETLETTYNSGLNSYTYETYRVEEESTTVENSNTHTITYNMEPLLGGLNLTTTSQSYSITTSFNRKELGVYKSYVSTESRSRSIQTTEVGTITYGKSTSNEEVLTTTEVAVLSETTYLTTHLKSTIVGFPKRYLSSTTAWVTSWQPINPVISYETETSKSISVPGFISAFTTKGTLSSTTQSVDWGYVATYFTNSQILNDVYGHRSVTYTSNIDMKHTGTDVNMKPYDGPTSTISSETFNILTVPKWTATMTRTVTTTIAGQEDPGVTTVETEGYTYDTITSTSFYRAEYVSLTWDRLEGDYVLQKNRRYTDNVSYMMTDDFDGISVTQLENTYTSATSSRKSTYSYYGWGYSIDWWTYTETDWNATSASKTSMPHFGPVDTYDWANMCNTTTMAWYTETGTKMAWYTTTYTTVRFDNSWVSNCTYAASRSSYYEVAGAGIVTKQTFVSKTDDINTVSMSYQNISTNMNKTMVLSLMGTGSLVKYTNIPCDGISSISTIFNMGMKSVETTTKVSTYEYL